MLGRTLYNHLSYGTLIPHKMSVLKQIDTLLISIDGREHIYNVTRGVGVFPSLMKSMDLCVSNSIPFNIKMVINRITIKEIDWNISLAHKYGVEIEFVLPYEVSSDKQPELHKKLSLSDSEILNILEEILCDWGRTKATF